MQKILIVAGGTGGHIFPALAFGRWATSQKKAEQVAYLSGSRPLELEIYASQGVQPHRLSLSGSPLGSSSVVRNFRRWMELLYSFFQTGRFLIRERPDACFLFGGYVSLMPLLWCRFLGIPAIAHEQNACAGKVTRLAALLGVPVASGWNECRGVKAFTPVGIPVRSLQKISRAEAASLLGIGVKDGDFVVGVIGGSLSSASLSASIEKISEAAAGVEDIGKIDEKNVVFIVLSDIPASPLGKKVYYIGRRWDMNPFYSLCDAVVCRGGASTLAEVAVYRIPALVVPWRLAADGHQEANARCFAASTGSAIWQEGESAGSAANTVDIIEEVFFKFLTRARDAKSEEKSNPASDAASLALWRFGQEKRG